MTSEERVAEIEQFLHYTGAEWPRLRLSVSGSIAARCQRCIVSDKFLPLQAGICPLCSSNQDSIGGALPEVGIDTMQQKLQQILQSYQGLGTGHYDALILYSGGKDSTLLLHKLSTEYPGLRLLALFIDNGFASGVVFQNIRQALEKLAVDLTINRPQHSLFQKTFRHALRNRPQDGYPLVDRLDGELSFDIGRNLAASLEIPLVVIGLAPEQVEKILNLTTFESPRDWETNKNTMREFGLESIYSDAEKTYWWDARAWPEHRRPRVLYPFYAWQLSEPFIRSEVVRLGLIDLGRAHPLLTNNDLVFVNIAVDIMDRGYSGFEPGFAHMVRQGMADRTGLLHLFEAAEYLTRTGQFVPACIDDTLAKLRLSRQDLGLL